MVGRSHSQENSWGGRGGGHSHHISPVERLSYVPSLETPLHGQFYLSVLILGQGAALWSLHGRIHCLRLSMAPPSPPVE